MIYKIPIFSFAIFFSGCAYVNDCGISYHYYDKPKYYYDSQGNYVMECPKTNVIDFKDDVQIDYLNQE